MKRRKKLRIDRIIYCLVIFVLLIVGIFFGIKALLNLRISSSIKKNNSVRFYKQNVNVFKKTIKYVHENMDTITIKYRKYSVEMNSDKFKNGLNLKVKTYNKYIDEALFDNVKSLYIENNSLLKDSNKLTIKLPRYLYKHNTVDVYGVKNKKEIVLLSPKVKIDNKYITFKLNKNYDDYFVTYISGKSISSSNNITIEVGEKRNLNVKINPSNATNSILSYSYDKKIVSLKAGYITGIKKGSTVIKVESKVDKVTKEINVTVKEKKVKKKETKKEEVKEVTTQNKINEVDGITYVDGIMIVNKTYSLPSTYDPGGLTDEFMNAFSKMQSAASLDGIYLFVASGYRSYNYQEELYNAYVQRDGKEAADTYSARAGHSEHQTGLAADINAADSSFEDTPEALWLDENCYKYGFVIRFPKGKEAYTGYKYEPWHLRYVGEEIAKKIHDAGGISLEEYYKIESKYKD